MDGMSGEMKLKVTYLCKWCRRLFKIKRNAERHASLATSTINTWKRLAPITPHGLTILSLKYHPASNGMTLRDYFAAKAMQSFKWYGKDALTSSREEALKTAKNCYFIADAMIEAREGGGGV